MHRLKSPLGNVNSSINKSYQPISIQIPLLINPGCNQILQNSPGQFTGALKVYSRVKPKRSEKSDFNMAGVKVFLQMEILDCSRAQTRLLSSALPKSRGILEGNPFH